MSSVESSPTKNITRPLPVPDHLSPRRAWACRRCRAPTPAPTARAAEALGEALDLLDIAACFEDLAKPTVSFRSSASLREPSSTLRLMSVIASLSLALSASSRNSLRTIALFRMNEVSSALILWRRTAPSRCTRSGPSRGGPSGTGSSTCCDHHGYGARSRRPSSKWKRSTDRWRTCSPCSTSSRRAAAELAEVSDDTEDR